MRETNMITRGKSNDGSASARLTGTILNAAAIDIKDLDAIMRNKFCDQPDRLTAWQRASRVEAAHKRGSKPADGMSGDNPRATAP